MERPQQAFSQFRQFLDVLFIGYRENGFNNDDFQFSKFKYLLPHLESHLPSVSFEEAKRIQIYFHYAYQFHMTGTFKTKPMLWTDPAELQEDVEIESLEQQQQEIELVIPQQPPVEDSEILQEPPQQSVPVRVLQQQQEIELVIPQQQPVEDSEILQEPPQQSAPVRVFQSTPLPGPFLNSIEEQTPVSGSQQQPIEVQQDDFIASINLLPIHTTFLEHPPAPPENNIGPDNYESERTGTFLRAFANIETEAFVQEQPRTRTTSNKAKKRPAPHRVVTRKSKKRKKNKIPFEDLCSISYKKQNEKQAQESMESFLYFPLISGKSKYRLARPIGTSLTQAGNQSSLSSDKISNFSYILRNYASQSDSSVRVPVSITSTPQSLSRDVCNLPFTPNRSVNTSELVTNPVQSRSKFHQTPLLVAIPERNSSIQITNNDMQFAVDGNASTLALQSDTDQSATANIVRSAPTNQLESFEEQSLQRIQIIDPSLSQFEQNSIQQTLNINPTQMPLESIQEQSFNITENTAGELEAIEQPPEPPQAATSTHGIESERAPVPVESIIPDIAPNNDRINYYEILRSRNNLIDYQQDESNGTRRKRRRRRRRRPRRITPDILVRPNEVNILPISPSDVNPLISTMQHTQPEQASMNFEELSISQQLNVSVMPDTPQNNTGITTQSLTRFQTYADVLKRVAEKADYNSWEYNDTSLFNKDDNFQLYTHIFKRLIQDNYVAMEGLFESGITRLEAAKGFRFILELKTMNLIEIESIGTQITGFRIRTRNEE